MDSLYSLKVIKANLQNDITQAKGKINQWEREYESLLQFKGVVESSQAGFSTGVNVAKNQLMVFPNNELVECKTAQIYQDKMSGYLDGTGIHVIGVAFDAFLGLISLRLKALRAWIDVQEQVINQFKWRLEEVIYEIEALKEALKKEGQV